MRHAINPIHWKSALAARHACVWTGLSVVIAMSWFLLVRMDAGMSAAGAGALAPGGPASAGNAVAPLSMALAMWAIMMVAMMLPTLPPSVAMFSTLAMRRDPLCSQRATASYIAGYTACWIGFAMPAAALQWGLTSVALLDPVARSTSQWLNAIILLGAGLYQFSSLKRACLAKCRTPLGFFMAHWRDGVGGAFRLGIRHGAYCVACCWTLMVAMFVVGAMNLVWMSLFTLVVLGEKIIPARWRFDRMVGATLVGSGLWVAVNTWAGG